MMNQEDFVKLEDLRRQGWTIKEIAAVALLAGGTAIVVVANCLTQHDMELLARARHTTWLLRRRRL